MARKGERLKMAGTSKVFGIVKLGTMAFCLLGPFSSSADPPANASKSPSATSKPASLLTNDARLDRQVSLDEIGTPLKDLLNQLSRKGLILQADRNCSAQKLHIRLKQRPLRTLMTALAQMLPGQWEPLEEKQGYMLMMHPSAVRRRTEWWRLYLEERERAQAEARTQVLHVMRKAPYRRRPDDPNPENSNLAIEAEIADKQDFIRALPEALQEQVANRLLDFRYYNLQGDVPMGFYEEAATVVPVSALPPQSKEKLQNNSSVKFFASKRDIDWDKVALRFENTGFVVSVSIALPNGEGASIHEMLVGHTPDTVVLWLDHTWLVEAVQEMGKKAPSAWKTLAAYQQSRVWKNPPPAKKPIAAPRPRRADALKRLGTQGDIEFVSDYYSLPGMIAQQEKPESLTRPLAAELALFAVEQDSSWKLCEENLYLFRDNRWYRNDYLEVPAERLREWYAPDKGSDPRVRRINIQAIPSLAEIRQRMDWMAEVVTSLNLWQICNGLLYFSPEEPSAPVEKKPGIEETHIPDPRDTFPFRDDVNRILHEYQTIQFYASLGAPQRTALLEKRLPFIALNAVQQKKALALLSLSNPSAQALITPQTFVGLQSNVGKEVMSFHNLPRLRMVFGP